MQFWMIHKTQTNRYTGKCLTSQGAKLRVGRAKQETPPLSSQGGFAAPPSHPQPPIALQHSVTLGDPLGRNTGVSLDMCCITEMFCVCWFIAIPQGPNTGSDIHPRCSINTHRIDGSI